MPETARIRRDGDRLVLAGRLDRSGVAALDSAPIRFEAVDEIDVSGVSDLDSSGLALVAHLVGAVEATGRRPRVSGRPAGLEELCLAYRIDPDFSAFP